VPLKFPGTFFEDDRSNRACSFGTRNLFGKRAVAALDEGHLTVQSWQGTRRTGTPDGHHGHTEQH
jgi:hypothetical protein